MKSIRILLSLFIAIGLLQPVADLSAQAAQPSSMSSRFQSLTSKAKAAFSSATSLLKQKSYCLINYDSCTKRDKIAISNAFGFMMGYGIQYTSLIDKALQKVGVSPYIISQSTTRDLLIASLAHSFAQEVGLTGPLMMSKGTGHFGHFIHDFSLAPNKTAFLARERGLFQASPALYKIVLLLTIATEAISIVQEASYAIKYENQSYLTSIARYLKMNVKCIWDEKQCMPQDNAEHRRLGLYFWLGYIQGRVARELQARFFTVAPAPAVAAPGLPPAPAPALALPASRFSS